MFSLPNSQSWSLSQTTLTGLKPDTGLDRVIVNMDASPKQQKLYLQLPCDQIIFNYTGRVTMTPVEGAIKVAECFNESFYVLPDGFDSFDKDVFVPAWFPKPCTQKQLGAKDKKMADYMLTPENLEKMREFNDSKKT